MKATRRVLEDEALNVNLWATTRAAAVYCVFTLTLPVMAYAGDHLTYTRHSHGWTIEYPTDWDINTTEANFVEIKHPELDALCGIHSGNTEITSAEELTDIVLSGTEDRIKRQLGYIPQVVERGQVEAPPSVAGVRVLVDMGTEGRSLSVYFVNAGKLAIGDCETYTSVWRLVEQEFIDILSSISFEITQAAISYESGIAALQDGNYDAAVEHLLEAAEGGDARAQYGLGILTYQGRGIEKNKDDAIRWLRNAAQQGQLDAQAAFWQIRLGSGVSILSPPAAEEAFSWMRTAAENGHLESQFQFAMQLLHGNNILEKNLEEALRWFLLVARQGDAHAQHEAGAILFDDSGPMFDIEAAYGWLSLAIANGRQAAVDIRQMAASHLSLEEKMAVDEKVNKCLDTNYSECDF